MWTTAPSGLLVPSHLVAANAALDKARRFRAWLSQLCATGRRRQHDSSTRRAIHNTATRRALHNKSSDSACNCGCGKCYCPLCSTAGSTTKCWFNVDASDIDYQLCDDQCVGGLSASNFFTLEDFNDSECDVLSARIKTAASVIDPNGSFDHAGGGGTMVSGLARGCTDEVFCQWGLVGNFSQVSGVEFGGAYGPDGLIYLDTSTGSCYAPFDTDGSITNARPYWSWVLRKTAEAWTLAYAADLRFIFPGEAGRINALGIMLYKFYGTLDATDADDCGESLTFTSALAGCGPLEGVFDSEGVKCDCTSAGGVSLASGGTAVVTWTDTPP